MKRFDLTRIPAYAIAAGLAIGFGQLMTASPVTADVYRTVRVSLDKMLSDIAAVPEKRPRDLTANGQKLNFTPYLSDRSVNDIASEWLATLKSNTQVLNTNVEDRSYALFAASANTLVAPRSSRAGDDFAVIVQFFDGDASSALAFMNDKIQSPDNGSKMPGVAVSIRRPNGASQTEVLMTRFDNVPALLSSFDKPASSAALPPSLRPPPGVGIIADFGDKGSGHTSRTVISSGNVSAAQWSDQRADILRREGFSVEVKQARSRGVIALHGRRDSVEADILYTRGKNSAETVEVIEIRQPQS